MSSYPGDDTRPGAPRTSLARTPAPTRRARLDPASAGRPRPGPLRHFRRARARRRRGPGTRGGARGGAQGGGAGEGGVSAAAAAAGQRSSRRPALTTGPVSPPGLCPSVPGALTSLTRAEAGVSSVCEAAGTAPAPVSLPDPFFPAPQSWGTRRPPRKAARWRAVSQGPGLGTRGAGRRGAPSAPLGRCPEAADTVQASHRRLGAAGGGPGDQLPSSPSSSTSLSPAPAEG